MGGKMIKKGRKFTSFDYNIVLILSGSISASSCIISAALSSNFFSIKPKRTTHCPTSGVGWVRLRRLECERWKRVQLKGPYQMEGIHGGRWDWKKCNWKVHTKWKECMADGKIEKSATKRSIPNGSSTWGTVRLKKVQLKGPYQMEGTHGRRWDWLQASSLHSLSCLSRGGNYAFINIQHSSELMFVSRIVMHLSIFSTVLKKQCTRRLTLKKWHRWLCETTINE